MPVSVLSRYRKNEKEKRLRDNEARRIKRRLKRMKRFEGKDCLLCEIRMDRNSRRGKIYCDDCTLRFPKEVERHKWRRYYYRTLKPRMKLHVEWKKVKNKQLGGYTYVGRDSVQTNVQKAH